MGVYQYDDPKTGQGYDLSIVGDVPTEEEFARLANKIRQDRTAFLEDYEQRFGTEIEFDDGTALGRGFGRGTQQIKQAVGETIGTLGEQTGLGFLADYGQGVEERAGQELGLLSLTQPERMQSTDVDSIGSALTYAGELVGEQIPQLGLGLGAAVAAPVLAGATGVAAPFLIGAGAAGAVTAPILFGNNIQRQEDEVAAGKKDRVDVSDALVATFGQATLEGVADKLLLGGVLKPIGKSIFTRTISRAGGGATSESLTEVGQQMLERSQAGLPVDSEDAIAEYREAAIAGGLIGGGTRSTLGAFGDRPADVTPPTTRDEATVEPTATTTTEPTTEPAVETAQVATPEEVAAEPTVETAPATAAERARLVLAAKPELATYSDDYIRDELKDQYSPELLEAIIAERKFMPAATVEAAAPANTQQKFDQAQAEFRAKRVVTKEMLDDIGVSRTAALRKRITGLDVTDEAVKADLLKYADNPNPKVKAKADKIKAGVAALLGDSDATGLGTGVTTGDAGVGDGVTSGTERVAELGRRVRASGSADTAATPDEGPVGGSVLPSELPAVADGADADTLKARAAQVLQNARKQQQKGSMQLVSKTGAKSLVDAGLLQEEDTLANPILLAKVTALLAEGPETVLNRVGAGTLETEVAPEAVADLTEQVDAIVTEPVTLDPAQQGSPEAAAERKRIAADPQAYAKRVQEAKEASGYNVPAEVLVDSDEIANRKATLAAGVADPVQVAPNAGLGGATLGTAGQNIPAPIAPAPRPEPVTEAPDPYAAMMGIPDVSNEAAQQALNARFYAEQPNTIDGKIMAKARKFHEDSKSLFETSEADPTTTGDKQAILALLDGTKKARTDGEKGAIAFFSKYRRPDVALAQMGAASRNGFASSPAGRTEIKTDEEAFYFEQTRKKAIAARLWVEANLSPEANSLVREYAELYAKTSVIESDESKITAPESQDQKEFTENRNKRQALDLKILADEDALLDDGVDFSDTSIEGIDLDAEMFLFDPVLGLNNQLMPTTMNGLRNGDLKASLLSIAGTNPVPRIRQIAAKLAEVVGTTKVQVMDDISPVAGRTAAGMFDPETNTISIDANRGLNVHTVLHEMTHAATSASLTNLSLPEVKQLQSLLSAMRTQLGDVYGTKNLNEFVAEAFSNPKFQTALALSRVDGGKMSGWEKFTGAIRRIVRKILGLKPKGPESALDEVDRIINGMLAPSPATRGAPAMMLMQRTKEGASRLVNRHLTVVPMENKNLYEAMRDIINANTPRKVKQAVLAVQPINSLARLAKAKIPFADELNVLIDQQSNALREGLKPVAVIADEFRAYKKSNRKGYDRMLPLMNRATQDEVDPARPRSTYSKYWMSYYDMGAEKTETKSFDTEADRAAEIKRLNDELEQKYGGQDKPRSKAKKSGDPSTDKAAVWDTLRQEYEALGPEGQRLYKVAREMGEAAQDRIMPAIKARIASLGIDADAQRTAFEKLSELLHAQGGVIRPYFRLSRGGDFRLSYHAPDPLRNGGIELFTEYYHSEKDMMQAAENVKKYLTDIGDGKSEEELKADIATIEIGKRESNRDYGKAPSSSFVFDILSTLQATGADQQTIDRIIDLSLDAIPERSFMQSFRSRKERSDGNRGVLGALGDRTPSGMPGMNADLTEMFEDNFRGIEKQLVQLEYGAKIQGFRNKLKSGDYFTNLETADIAEKIDQIAVFAQSPSVARWAQIATSMGFGWTMGANISSALNIMFDMPMAVAPYLGGEYGVGKTLRAFRDANRLFMGSPSTKMVTVMGPDGKPEVREVKQRVYNKGFENHNFDDPNLDPKIRKHKTVVERAGARGMFNESIDQEHVDLSEKRDFFAKMSQASGFLVHHGERYSRQLTLLAANELELNNLTGGTREPTQAEYEAAAQKAMETAELTLGSTASAGRPVWAQNPVGHVAFLFKKFAVSRYYFMAHLLDQSLAGADPETRKIARQQLAYFMMSTAALAGVGGLPLMGAAGVIYDAFADDDEDTFEALLRKKMGGTLFDGLANEIFGIDIASRVEMNSLLYRQPFIDKDQSALYTLFEQLGGPVVGVGLSMERGYGLLQEGNIQRGLEAIAPAVMRNASKAQRFATEGANTMRGDPIVDDVNPYNVAMQLIGFAPADYVENLKINSNERRKQNVVDERRRKLMRQYNMARTEGDLGAMGTIREKIREFNVNLPRSFQADSRIEPEDLEKSYTGFVKTTGNMVNGIVYTDAMRRNIRDYNN